MAKGNSGFDSRRGSKLPQLEGTEKQIAWAERIREDKIENYPYKKLMDNSLNLEHDFYVVNMENFLQIGDKKYREFEERFIKNNPEPDRNDKKALENYEKRIGKMQIEYRKFLWKEFQNLLKTQKSAKWWIENRHRY